MASTSALTLEDSRLAKFYRAVEESVFSVVYNVQKTRDDDLVRVNYLTGLSSILLDFIQVLPFLVHGYGYNSMTLTWGRFVRYAQLQLELTTWDAFSAPFWAAVVITLLIFANAGFLVYQSYQKQTMHPISLNILNYSYNVVLHILFIAGFKLLLTPWWCNSVTQKLFPFELAGEAISCFGMPNLINLIVGSLAAVLLVSSVLIASISTVNYAPVPFDLFATSTPIYRIALYLAMMFMTIDENLIALSIPGVGRWWEAMFNLLITSGLLALIVYYLPFQLRLANEIRAAFTAVLWWTSAVTFVVVNMNVKNGFVAPIMDYILLAGMIPAAAAGVVLVRERYFIFNSVATALVEQIEDKFESQEVYKAKFGSKKEDFAEGSNRDPLLNLPVVIQQFGADPTIVEIIGRLLWHNSGLKENVEAAYRFYRKADYAFPDIAKVKLLRATCFTYLSPDPTAFVELMDAVEKVEMPFLIRFLYFKRGYDAKRQQSAASSEGLDNGNKLDLVAYVEFQKYYAEAQKFNSRAIRKIRDFWTLFLQPEIATSAFLTAAKEIEVHTQKALATYKTLLVRYPKQIYILSSYAYFLELVVQNAEEAQRYHRRADQLRAREADDSGLMDGSAEAQAVVAISEDGTIEQINKNVSNMFGWARAELIGRNVKLLVPSPYREKHDQFLDRYKSSGNAKVIGQPPRQLIGLHKLGYSFPIMLTVQEKRKENGDRQYVGSLIHTDVDSQEGLIIITEDGMIQAISKNVELMFGYKASDILRENVNVLMTDAYATNHDSYLARYRESGEQHVIGTAGRNVPARRKDGTVFPVHLEIEEQYLLGERFFVGHLTDTSTLSAVIYMDGFGIIQNTDANVSKLLGYQKADLAGKNIKGIMPSPYSEYHDGYLERFRRTKITNILRNTEGRNLPAIHADGSVVQLKAIIARSDLGDGGSSGRYLFKGIIKRLDTFSLNTNVRPGFDDHHLIEMKKDGTITAIDPSVLRLLGYNSEKGPEDYIGQSIDTLVPLNPAAGRQMASSWMSQALTNPDLNFYIQLVTKSYTPMPFTFALAMKSTDTIIMRLRDLTSVDAIVTIDEAGTVLSMNEDSALLLGHEPDEVIGRNLKTIMAEELASNHDSYLQRYKETRVKHIIGSSQAIDTIHRDQSVMSVEIQIVDIPTREGLNYIARIRHASLQNKFDKDAIDGLFVDLKGRKDNNELKEEIFVGSTTGSQVLKSQGSIVESNASGSQAGVNHIEGLSDSEEDSDDEEEEEAILAELEELSKKVKNIKTSQAEDPINKKLRIGLNIVAAIYICLLTVAIITFNLLEKPFDLYIFGDEVNIQGTYLNDLIYIARVTYLQTHSDEVLQLLTADYETQDYWPCTWGSKPYTFNRLGPNNVATGVMTTIPTCVFSEKLNATYSMEKYVKELKHAQEWFSVKYPTIRVEGDILDSVYNSPFDYYEFDNGTANPPSTHEVSTWADFIGSKVIDAADKLIKSPNITSGESRLDWQFIIYNRDIMTGRINSLQKAVYGKIEYLMGVELIAHLVFTVATLLSFAAAFYFILYFRIQGIQRDRVSLLKLLLLIPKTTIFEFVSTIYRDQEEEDDDGMEDGKSTASGSRKTDILKRLKKMHSDEVVDVKVDNSYGLYIFFGVGLLSVSLPLVAHVIYRFVFNANYAYELHQYMDVLELFADIHSLLWRSTGLWAIRGYVPTRDMRFWYNMNDTTYRLNAATNEVYSRYYIVQKDFAGDDEFSALLYGVNQLKDVYKSCQDEEKVKVTIRSGSNYTYPAQYAGKQYYEVPKKDFRCNDKYDTTYSTPPELALPYDYSLHTTRGVGLYIRSLLKSAWVVAQTPGYEVNKPLGPIDTPDYWYIIESLPDEGVDAVYALKVLVRDRLLASYSETILAYNVTYIVTLVYVFILFFWVFAKVQEELNAEAQHNRGLLTMVPLVVVARCKPMVEYIERVYNELNDC